MRTLIVKINGRSAYRPKRGGDGRDAANRGLHCSSAVAAQRLAVNQTTIASNNHVAAAICAAEASAPGWAAAVRHTTRKRKTL